MITNDVSTLKIHKLTQAQYDRELAAGRLDENALYLTPDEDIEIADVVGLQASLDAKFDKSGGTVTGSILSDDAYMHDIGSETNPFGIVYAGTFSGDLSGNATTATTATACSGNAATATALTTSAGDSNTPVYFSGGKPVKCTSLDLNTSGSSASCTGNAATATKLATARTISLTGDVTGSVSFDGSRDASMEVAVANNSHEHARLVNGVYSNGRVTMLYNNETSFSLVPGETRDSDGTAVFLGVGGNPYAGLYTNFVTSGGHIEATSGNIVATNGLVQAKTQVYSKGELTADGALAVGGAATIDGNVSIGGITTVTQRIVPAKTNNVNLGLSDRRWMGIYSTSSVNVSSDLNVKKDLAEIDDRYIKLFDLVQPYAYRFIDGNSGRVHTGFISQYVEEAMEQVGLSDMDLGFFCKDALFKEIKDEDGNVIGQEPVLDEDGNQKYFYSLRYEEYIAIMTEKIKRMEKRIDELETKLDKVDEIESRLAALEA